MIMALPGLFAYMFCIKATYFGMPQCIDTVFISCSEYVLHLSQPSVYCSVFRRSPGLFSVSHVKSKELYLLYRARISRA